jgi:hypothetical protein
MFMTAREIGLETNIIEKPPLYCTSTHIEKMLTYVHSACPGTQFYNFYHGQSEAAL